MIPAPEADCRLHPQVEVRPSPIAGRGLFARTAIPAGTAVSRLRGRLVSTGDLRRGRVTGDDRRRPDLRRRYGNHRAPALLERIERAGSR
jgi:hypothetical protein